MLSAPIISTDIFFQFCTFFRCCIQTLAKIVAQIIAIPVILQWWKILIIATCKYHKVNKSLLHGLNWSNCRMSKISEYAEIKGGRKNANIGQNRGESSIAAILGELTAAAAVERALLLSCWREVKWQPSPNSNIKKFPNIFPLSTLASFKSFLGKPLNLQKPGFLTERTHGSKLLIKVKYMYNNISLLSKSVRKCEVGVKEQMHSWSCWLKRGPGCCLPMSEEGSVSSRGAEDWDFGKNLFWKSVTFQHCDYLHYHPIAVPVQQCFSIRGSLAVETPLHTRKSLLWLFLWNPPAVELQNVSFSGSEPEEWWGRSWKQKGFSALPERYGHYFRHHHHHHFHKYLYRCHHGHHQIICLLSSSLTLSWIYHEYHIAKHLLNYQKPARFRPLRLQTLKLCQCDPHNGYWTLH